MRNTALISACARGIKEVALRILVRPDVDVNVFNALGNTALIHACVTSITEVALRILERPNVDVNVRKMTYRL